MSKILRRGCQRARCGTCSSDGSRLAGGPPTPTIAKITARTVEQPTPKYELINGVLAEEDLDEYEYVLVIDDDIVLPRELP